MLGRQKRRDSRAWNVVPEVDDEMPQVVFFSESDGAVCEKDVRAVPRQTLDRVIGVDPRVHARGSGELGARRPEFRGDDRRFGLKILKQCRHVLCDRHPTRDRRLTPEPIS